MLFVSYAGKYTQKTLPRKKIFDKKPKCALRGARERRAEKRRVPAETPFRKGIFFFAAVL